MLNTLSKEHRKNISKALKGKNTWSKGIKLSEETKEKISQHSVKFWLGKRFSLEHKKKLSLSHLGQSHKLTEEHKRKIGLSNLKSEKKIDSNGYVHIYNPQHPFCNAKKYVREHRLIIEKQIGRYLHKWELVHHINEIRNDNRVENLRIVSKSEHEKIHSRKARNKCLAKLKNKGK